MHCRTRGAGGEMVAVPTHAITASTEISNNSSTTKYNMTVQRNCVYSSRIMRTRTHLRRHGDLVVLFVHKYAVVFVVSEAPHVVIGAVRLRGRDGVDVESVVTSAKQIRVTRASVVAIAPSMPAPEHKRSGHFPIGTYTCVKCRSPRGLQRLQS